MAAARSREPVLAKMRLMYDHKISDQEFLRLAASTAPD
jgi:hypothetical protein